MSHAHVWHRRLAVLASAGMLAALAACGSSTSSRQPAASTGPGASIGPDGCITNFDARTDYFPDKQKLEHAQNFTLTYHNSYQVLTVKQPTQGGKPESYLLVKCGADKPKLTGELAKATVVSTPVKSLFSASTTHIPSLEVLGSLDLLTGVASKAYISSKAAQQRVKDPDVVEFAAAGTADAEKIVAAKPDALITGGFDDPAFATVRQAGIPVLADADFLETDPLGRAEWIKYFAALTGKEKQAQIVFSKVAENYRDAVGEASGANPAKVVVSQPYQGKWSVPAGGSYAGRLIVDAAGTWPWITNKSTGSIETDLETVFDKSGGAKIWLTSSNWQTRKDALAEEPRFAKFEAFKSGTVWAPSKQLNAAGGNNYFELGVLRPDLTVKDLIAILHPDLMPDHKFVFYQELK